MKKIALLLILVPFIGWSQNTDFTKEQFEFVDEFYEKFKNTDPTNEEFFLDVEGYLAKAPYHPNLVQSYLRVKFENNDFKFIRDYCNNLDDNYLSTFDPILVEVCACGYFFDEDYEGLHKKIIPLIEDKATKELFLTAYYFGIDNYEEFKRYAESSISRSYKYPKQMLLRDYLFWCYIVLLNSKENVKDFSTIIKEYEATIFSSNINMPIYILLIQSAVFNSDFIMAEKLINYVKKQNANNYKYLYPITALFYSHKGEESLAVAALDNALKLDNATFEKIIEAQRISNDIFNLYSMSIIKIEDYKTRERLVSQAVAYFDKRDHYRVRFKAYQSLLYASKDINKARAILKECTPYLKDQNLKDLDFMIRMENELGKENPNYRLVDDLMTEVLSNIASPELNFLRIVYRDKVNSNSKQPIFSLDEIVDEFDKILKKPLDRETKQKYTRMKILFIAKDDLEWANRELEKLPEDEAAKIMADVEATEIDSQKIAEILISDKKSIKDINENIDLINVAYINIISLKN
jgi:hypothetical protein